MMPREMGSVFAPPLAAPPSRAFLRASTYARKPDIELSIRARWPEVSPPLRRSSIRISSEAITSGIDWIAAFWINPYTT